MTSSLRQLGITVALMMLSLSWALFWGVLTVLASALWLVTLPWTWHSDQAWEWRDRKCCRQRDQEGRDVDLDVGDPE